MPELPECERARKRIADGALNRTITAVRLGEDTTHVDVPGKSDRDRFVGHQFTETHRHGKFIFAGSKTGPWLMIHLGMTGSLRVIEDGEPEADYIRFIVEFEGGSALTFRDPRKFGEIVAIEDPQDYIEKRGLGPDAMQIGDNAFAEAVGGSRGAVKSALLDQGKLAGVGNLWSDETLFRAGVMPDAKGTDLSSDKVGEIYAEMRNVLQGVLDVNAHYAELPDDWLIHRREDGADCPRCGGTITKTKVGGRTAYHCPDHQERS